MRTARLPIYVFILLLLISPMIRCKQAYEPPAVKTGNNFLVVDGFINTSANAITSFRLARTRNLGDSVTVGIPELHARVSIVGPNGIVYPLSDKADTGAYASTPLNLDNTQRYSIAITTSDGRKYSSDAIPCKQTPPIDSVYWRQPGDLTIYVDAHDPAGNTHFYRYDYTETWEHDAKLTTPYAVVNGMIIVVTDPRNQVDRCWSTAPSTNILVATSSALSQDIISSFPLTTLSRGDDKAKIRYSILVRQYAITQDAYNYWLLFQKTSQGLGTLFDLQPTQLTGNIHCLSNPAEPVIGFLSAGSVQQQRIFVDHTALTGWVETSSGLNCDTLTIAPHANVYEYDYPDTNFAPYYFHGNTALIIARKTCLYCTSLGGTNIKPSFWQ